MNLPDEDFRSGRSPTGPSYVKHFGMKYVRCIKNEGYAAGLGVGKVYKTLPTTETERKSGLVRVIDNDGEDYLYDTNYFQSMDLGITTEPGSAFTAMTIQISQSTKAILQAEALASHKSTSALVREWIDERLDLSAN